MSNYIGHDTVSREGFIHFIDIEAATAICRIPDKCDNCAVNFKWKQLQLRQS